ncbi:MAG TPA: spore coat U domain-containing protein [Rhizomicrobium sp.]|nr:spore coat U domain-containing protein [Rhizomicrobium sp.]
MIRAIGLAGLLLILASAPAHAAATCTLSSTGVVFGAFSGSALTFSGTVTIHCTGSGTSNYNLKLSAGGSGTYSARRMSNGANNLTYNLYQDAAFSQIWGDGTGGTFFPSGQIKLSPPPSVDIIVPIYGSLPAQATPAPGTYSDSVVATLTCTSGGACTTTTTIPITASVQPSCTISATNLNFGNYARAQLDGLSTIQLNCANATTWNVGLNAGVFPGATVTTRSMAGPSAFQLNYSLFSNPARSINWGNTVGTDTVSGTGTGASQTLNVYGRIPAAQNVGPGSYVDTIVATITF